MGFRGVPSSDLYLDGCEVPLDNIIVPAGGFKQLMEAFDLERCGNATMALGQASGALEDVSDYVQERSEERRVGKGCVSTCRSLWSPYHLKKKKIPYNNT